MYVIEYIFFAFCFENDSDIIVLAEAALNHYWFRNFWLRVIRLMWRWAFVAVVKACVITRGECAPHGGNRALGMKSLILVMSEAETNTEYMNRYAVYLSRVNSVLGVERDLSSSWHFADSPDYKCPWRGPLHCQQPPRWDFNARWKGIQFWAYWTGARKISLAGSKEDFSDGSAFPCGHKTQV